jgi:hypothetical protein
VRRVLVVLVAALVLAAADLLLNGPVEALELAAPGRVSCAAQDDPDAQGGAGGAEVAGDVDLGPPGASHSWLARRSKMRAWSPRGSFPC